MNQDGKRLVLNNLVGLGLGAIGLISFTAGLYFEVVMIGLLVSIPFIVIQLIRQPNWTWRLAFIVLLIFQIYTFSKPEMAETFQVSTKGYFLMDNQIEYIQWSIPISAGLCLTSFWIVLISTMKKSLNPLPNKR